VLTGGFHHERVQQINLAVERRDIAQQIQFGKLRFGALDGSRYVIFTGSAHRSFHSSQIHPAIQPIKKAARQHAIMV